jgi:hypothetical protein
MNINIFDDPNQVPQPRDKIRIQEVKVTPYPDRFRVYVEVKVTPFLERPNLLLYVRDHKSAITNEASVIATMHANMEFTLHMRHAPDPAGDYSLEVELFYETRNPPLDKYTILFSIPQA